VQIEARSLRPLAILGPAVPCDGDQRDVSVERVSLHAACDFVPVDAGQADIDEQDIGLVALCHVENRIPLMHDLDLVTEGFEQERQSFGRVPVVFDDHDPRGMGAAPETGAQDGCSSEIGRAGSRTMNSDPPPTPAL
jgi:hypothetical protein